MSNSVTLSAVSCQTSLSYEFSRQEYWSGLPFPPPADLPDPGSESMSLTSPALAGKFFTTSHLRIVVRIFYTCLFFLYLIFKLF